MTLKHNTILGIFVTILFSTILWGCGDNGDDIIWDFAPVEISLDIVDENGLSLLYENAPGNILSGGITATYEGVEYKLDELPDESEEVAQTMKTSGALSRYYPATFYGLYINRFPLSTNGGNETPRYYPFLSFGEFQGFENFDKTVVFHIPSLGRDITFRIVSEARWKGKTPDWKLTYYMDGTPLEKYDMRAGVKITVPSQDGK